jgi:6-hydroxynicotinate 3-monooxygenase
VKERKLSAAIIGAGIGGLTAAATLLRAGLEVHVYEQASQFTRIGAGIQQAPNAVRVLGGLGLLPRLRELAFRPAAAFNREWDTGELTNSYPLGDAIEERFGAPYLLMHRGDLHAAIASAVPTDLIHLNRKLGAIETDRTGVTLHFAGGERLRADLAIGADGVHSTVRESLFGTEAPRFTGRVAYRTTFPARLLGGRTIDDNTKWWGPDRHIVMYYVTPRRDEIYFVTSTPEPGFRVESWSATGDLDTLREAYAGFHPQVQAVLAACPAVHKWALVERDPMPRWSEGRITLLGDACHPMTPYMAQGAATAIEDAAVLARCLREVTLDGVEAALQRFEDNRKPRTARIQLTSRQNTWMRQPTDADWLYGYDAWNAPLT